MAVSTRSNMGLRIIVFMGAATFLFLMLMAFGLRKSLQPQAGARVPKGAATSPFNEDRAWKDVQSLESLDGAAARKNRADYLMGQLRGAGLNTRRFAIAGPPSEAGATLSSLAGIVEGDRPGVLLLCGAIDAPVTGAANAAWLLEMGRVLGGHREGRSIWLVFLEGDSLADTGTGGGGFPESRNIVESLRAGKELALIDGAIALNGIGDCRLNVRKETGAPAAWIEVLWNTADRQGYGKYFGSLPVRIRGSHLAFREAGIPALALVDDSPDGTRRDTTPGANVAEGVCRESLRAVGDVIYHALAPLEGHLDETGMRNDGQ